MRDKVKTRDILATIESAMLCVFDGFDEGTITVRFMAFGPDIELAVTSSQFIDGLEASSLLMEHLTLTSLLELRDAMAESSRGTWLSGQAVLDCLTEEVKFTFNYNHRFNVLAEDWVYDEGDDEVWPDRHSLLQDLKRYPRSDDMIPDWYESLRMEQERVDQLVKETKPEDLFAEALNTIPVLDGIYAPLQNNAIWNHTWKELGETYKHGLLALKKLRRAFIDPDMGNAKAEMIFDVLEPHVQETFTEQFLQQYTPCEQASFLDVLAKLQGKEIPDCQQLDDDDWDMELLEEDLADVFHELIMAQTQQRFTDLDEYT